MGVTSSLFENKRETGGGGTPENDSKSLGPDANNKPTQKPSESAIRDKSKQESVYLMSGATQQKPSSKKTSVISQVQPSAGSRTSDRGSLNIAMEPTQRAETPITPNQKESKGKSQDQKSTMPTDASSMVTEGGNKKKAKKTIPLGCWILIGFIVIAVIAAVIVFIFVYNSSEPESAPVVQTTIAPSPPPTTPTCTTCTGYATALIASMNKTIKPCDNFHGYACGSHDYSKDKMVQQVDSKRFDELMSNERATSKGLPQMAKFFKEVCQKPITYQIFEKIATQVAAYNDGSTVEGSSKAEVFVNKLANQGFTNFGHFKLDMDRLMDPNEINPQTVLIIQDRTNFDSSDNFGFEAISKTYDEFIAFDESNNKINTTGMMLVRLVDIERGIPDIKKNLLLAILKGWFPDETTQESMLTNVWTYKYEYWTKDLTDTQKTTYANDDVQGKIIEFYKYFATNELEKAFKTVVFEKTETGGFVPKKDCHPLVTKMLPQAFINFDNIINEDVKKDKIIKAMFEEYKAKQLDVIGGFIVPDEMFKMLKETVKNMELVVGWPEKYEENREESSITINQLNMKEIFTALPEIKKFQLHQHFAHLVKPREYSTALFNGVLPRMIYDKEKNILYLNPRFLEEELFEEGYPSYVKHGGLGAVIGKTFADVLVEHAKMEKSYQHRSICYGMEEVYRPYGKSNRDEMVEDHIGAWLSYQMANTNDTPRYLPGFESYTNDQMFFLSMAKRMCATPYDGFPRRNDAGELKEIGKARINKLFINMPQFAAAYKCEGYFDVMRQKKERLCSMYSAAYLL